MTKTFGKYEQLNSSADKTTDPEALKSDSESKFSDLTVEIDEVLKKAREYINGIPETEKNFSVFR